MAKLEPKIIFEDEDIVVIDKPAGMVVNRAETVKMGSTLQDWIEKRFKIYDLRFKSEIGDFQNRSGIVHRLDKDTSGVMVIAKNPEAYFNLQKQFKDRLVAKKYLALVHGRVEPPEGNIRLPLARNPKDRQKFSVRLGGREALTFYKRIKLFKSPMNEAVSLLEVFPKTGRTHQIRVHLSHIGYPIVADPIYLGRKRLISDKEWCWRLFLHAKFLSFNHPKTGKRLEFFVDLPRGLRKLVD
jgi:23S rRNA pseudouridine1911/1915/1917 synthase